MLDGRGVRIHAQNHPTTHTLVVIGCGNLGKRMVEHLIEHSRPFAVIEESQVGVFWVGTAALHLFVFISYDRT